MRPFLKPQNPSFSSGPTRKRPGWSLEALDLQSLGRSHRSPDGLERIRHLIALMRKTLEIPSDYHLAIIPGSCTGAMEAALWSLLGPQPVDFISFDVFGELWAHDGLKELKLKKTRLLKAKFGELPDLTSMDPDHDVVLTWNGTSTGLCLSDGEWLREDRRGLVICDGTSTLFSMSFPWEKMDAVAFSWQKGLGGEGGHGMLVLSPRAVDRLNSYAPPWPMPRLFRLTREGIFNKGTFEGLTINTPSMLCIEDCIDALTWCEAIGGLPSLIARSAANLKVVEAWVAATPWIEFVAQDPRNRSPSSICLTFPEDPDRWDLPTCLAKRLHEEGIAKDILNHAHAIPALRLWGGAMVETSDMEALLPWITWAYENRP